MSRVRRTPASPPLQLVTQPPSPIGKAGPASTTCGPVPAWAGLPLPFTRNNAAPASASAIPAAIPIFSFPEMAPEPDISSRGSPRSEVVSGDSIGAGLGLESWRASTLGATTAATAAAGLSSSTFAGATFGGAGGAALTASGFDVSSLEGPTTVGTALTPLSSGEI